VSGLSPRRFWDFCWCGEGDFPLQYEKKVKKKWSKMVTLFFKGRVGT
jgi:hypothetical protein